MIRAITSRQLAFDVCCGLAFTVLRLLFGVDNTAFALAVGLLGISLALRRVSPALALAVAWLAAILQMHSGTTPDLADVAILVVLFSTARYGNPVVKWLGLASAVVGAFVATLYLLFRRPPTVNATEYLDFVSSMLSPSFFVALIGYFVALLAVLVLSWTAGLLVRTRATARDSRRDQLLAEQAVAVEQERNRIARDMHDVVAHSLAVVIAQADGARYAREADPSAVDVALTTISSTAREALADVRILLGQLRHSQDAGPQPALVDLERLVDQLRASGLLVSLEQNGDPLSIPAGRQLALYRIVQEGLTNALRHGDIEREVVAAIDWSPDAASLTIRNAVAEHASVDHVGHGLVGMRERALLAGGTFSAGPEGGDFVVRASIPVLVAS
ncbi:signal transduction histidine kinase [Salinibacterium sp. CAN_S4]|uniref:sensor histidine kinase n=1 Tax=Salinibacterium sp. CAN_S4 TaxID=2787727 RepID=UPI0018EFB7D8